MSEEAATFGSQVEGDGTVQLMVAPPETTDSPVTIPVVADGTDQATLINEFMANSPATTFVLPPGEFWIGSSIFVPEGKTLIGSGQDQTVLKVMEEFGPLPGWSAVVAQSDSRLADLTVDVNKTNNGEGTALRVCGVIGTGDNFLVENVTAKNVTGYAFWANGQNVGTPASGTFRSVTSENASIHFETTHADGVLFEDFLARDGDGDIGCYSVLHPAGDSINITFRNGSYSGAAQVVNSVAIIGDQTGIVFDNVHGETLLQTVAVWISGPYMHEVQFINSSFRVASGGNAMNAYDAIIHAENSTFEGGAIGIYLASGSAEFIDSVVSASTPADSDASAFALYGGPISWTGGSISASGGGAGTAAAAGTVSIDSSTRVIVDDYRSLGEGAPPSALGILGNDRAGADGSLQITGIDGVPIAPGGAVTLASGAIVTMAADGSLSYDVNGAFDGLATSASIGDDSFIYTLADGRSARVHLTIRGEADQTVNGTAAADRIVAVEGVSELRGYDGNDLFDMGATLGATDLIDGGAGSDTLRLTGDYTLGVKLNAGTLVNVETIQLMSAGVGRYNGYNLTTHEAAVASGAMLKVDGSALRYGETMMFYGSAETDGRFALAGGASNDYLFGGQQADQFRGGLGADLLRGNGGNDVFAYGSLAEMTGDKIDGGAGLDTLMLLGAFSKGMAFAKDTMVNVEHILLQSAGGKGYFGYNLTLNDATVASGQTLSVDGSTLRVGETLMFYGSAERDGRFSISGGAANDYLFGGAGADRIRGGLGSDHLVGNGGADIFLYGSTAESTGRAFDRLVGFNPTEDLIDLPVQASGIAAHVQQGSLQAATFDADLASALDGVLEASGSVLFTPDTGDFAGRTFAVVDGNGDGRYDVGLDYVFELAGSPIPSPGTDFFI